MTIDADQTQTNRQADSLDRRKGREEGERWHHSVLVEQCVCALADKIELPGLISGQRLSTSSAWPGKEIIV